MGAIRDFVYDFGQFPGNQTRKYVPQKLEAVVRRFLTPLWAELPVAAGILALVVLYWLDDLVSGPDAALTSKALAFLVLVGIILLCSFRALAHAGELGRRMGEPYGSMILTISILSIEVSLILAVMLSGKADPSMARDTMFAGLMLTMNGVVGGVLLVGGLRHRQQEFNLEGARAYLAALIPLAVIGLVLPNFTQAKTGTLTDVQALWIGLFTVLFYAIFLGVQTMRHREFFTDSHDAEDHRKSDEMPSAIHFTILFGTLIVIAFLAKELAVIVDFGIHQLRLPTALGGILIAVLTLTPESVSAFRAALEDKLQHSVNVFLGGALSTIGMTIPCVLLVGVLADRRVILGLQGTDLILLLLTLFVSSLTFGGVRTNVLQGAVHLLIFCMYLVLIVSP